MKKILKIIYKTILILLIASIVLPLGIWSIFQLIFTAKIFSTTDVSPARIAIVFGAGLQRDGTPSPVLKDRVAAAVNLLNNNKVDKLLLSGDNRFIEYNEPGAMQQYALELGAPAEALVLDYAGRRTYDTCFRAKHIFKVDEAILVTQKFHLPRSLFLCNQLGIRAVGVEADLRTYSKHSYQIWVIREILATTASVWDIYIRHPLPVLGEELPIK